MPLNVAGLRLLVPGVTLAVVAVVIAALIRWIAQISDIGRVGHTVDRVEAATADALSTLDKHPLFDCRAQEGTPKGIPVRADRLGYVQHFDASRLQELAEEHDLMISITARPGAYVSATRPLMLVEGDFDEKRDEEIANALAGTFVVGDQRSFDSDPRFGLVVLAEIADRALSPAVNDPGTAIDVVGTLTRLLAGWHPGDREQEVEHDRLSIPALVPQDLLDDSFRPIARDGAGIIEVVLRLLNSLEVIAEANPYLREAALATASDAVGRARKALTAEADLRALEEAARFV